MDTQLKSIQILGTYIASVPQTEILEYIVTGLRNKGRKFRIYTPNPEIITYATSHPEFKNILNRAQVSLPDGVGVVTAAKFLGKRLQGRVTGVNLMMELCKKCAKEGLSIGLFGGQPGVAEKTAECLWKNFPELKIWFIGSDWGPEGLGKAKEYSVSRIQNSERENKLNTEYSIQNTDHIDLLFVALGFPKQEEWISANLDNIPVTAAMGVGGAFDFLSGRVPRAPRFVQNLGFEWLFRLIIQPWRIKRQLALPKFIFLVLKEKFSRS